MNSVKIYPAPDEQECKIIILHLIGQAIKDYELFKGKQDDESKQIYESARDFLFDNDYYISWGDIEITLAQLCIIVELEIEWLRNKVIQKFDLQFTKDGVLLPGEIF